MPPSNTNSTNSTNSANSTNAPVLRGSPVPTTRPAGIGENSAEELPRLRGLGPENQAARESIDSLANEVTNTSGSIFVDAEKVFVKPPLLKSLITLSEGSPLSIDAEQSIDITLRDVLNSALSNNLPIKISQTATQEKKWNYIQALSGFLPSLTNDISYQRLDGNYVSPAGLAIGIHNPYLTMASGFQQYLFKGGGILYTAKQNQARYRASKFELSGTINDMLLESAERYYDLVRNDVLLQIRVKAVEVSKTLLVVNQDLFDNGVNTELDVLQAKYQLSADRQHLIKQQVARRKSAIKLATILNMDQGTDLSIRNRLVAKARLVDSALRPADLLKIAIDKRPELKRYEQLRLAAKDAIKVARSSLLPSVAVTGAAIGSGSYASNASLSSLQTQQTSLSSSGASVGAISSAGGLPLATGGNGPKPWTTRSLFTIGVDMQWNLGGLGLQEVAQVRAKQWEARRVQLEFNRELEKVFQEVRDSYLASISTENLIVETTAAVKYAEEGLRLAELRFKEGVGTYLDVINAQKSYTDSLIDKASAIIEFDQAQAKLLHAIGCLSVNTLTAAAPLNKAPM
ncbi:TolC family protein [bacterium]|nr:TolC family protein [bacterium]MBP9807408.1 TolC family protein [bacterium]